LLARERGFAFIIIGPFRAVQHEDPGSNVALAQAIHACDGYRIQVEVAPFA